MRPSPFTSQDIRFVDLTVTGNFDGATVLPAQTPPISRAPNGVTLITTTDVGLIDPDLAGGLARRPWQLFYMAVTLAGNGGANGVVQIVDTNGQVLWTVGSLSGVASLVFRGKRFIPPGARILINDDAAQAGNQVVFGLMPVDTEEDAIDSQIAQTIQMRAEGLQAARVGSTSTSVLLFATPAAILTEGIEESSTAAQGSIYTITRPGRYIATLGTTVPASGDLEIGIGINMSGNITADPDFALAGVEATARITAAAATSAAGMLVHVFEVTRNQVGNRIANVRFLASDGGGAAPAAGDIVSANTWAQIMYLGPLAA